ncbi:MAG: hypothetical protein J7518_00075 [Nocardioidaceae bacterium]|nr:hypothetical protein [Nocardioidaceae bacterium]
MSSSQPPVRRAKHLIDPSAPPRRQDPMSLTRVQRWVMSVLATTTIFHLSAGIVLAAVLPDHMKTGSRIGLCVIAAAFGVIAVACGMLIHGKKLPSPWLLLGTIPGIVGVLLVL